MIGPGVGGFANRDHTAEFLLDEEFDDPSAAAAWWQRSRHRFDHNLIRVE